MTRGFITHLDASLEHEKVVDCSFDSRAPFLHSSCSACSVVAVSALDEHLDNGVAACMVHDSSYHFDTLIKTITSVLQEL